MKKNILIICLVVFVLILLIGWFFQKNEIKNEPLKDETTNQEEKVNLEEKATPKVNQLEIVTLEKAKLEKVEDTKIISEVNHGPMIMLSYDEKTSKENPLVDFMYFVPLISPTLVDSKTSINNEQKASVVSYKKTTELSSNLFYLTCEFKMIGKGYHKNVFDSSEMIKRNVVDLKKGDTLKNILDYIKFEGEGFGCIEINGEITDSKEIVNEIKVHFNARNKKSPVTIGIYNVKSKDGKYQYENRFNEIVARVNTLVFKRSEGIPLMAIKLDSLSKKDDEEGFFSGVKGKIANLFIAPLEIDKFGNETMLDFGYAMFKQKSEFTFPKAKNLKKSVE
ncbi:MAG: hypothetical protein AABW67_01700 [Nanoarchaeota archaeon]